MNEIIMVLITAVGAAIVSVIGNNIMFSRERRAKMEDRRSEDFERKVMERIGDIDMRIKNISERQRLIEKADLSILHERLFQKCENYIKDGSIRIPDLETVDGLYEAYHALGGNGTGTKLYHDVKNLPVRPD